MCPLIFSYLSFLVARVNTSARNAERRANQVTPTEAETCQTESPAVSTVNRIVQRLHASELVIGELQLRGVTSVQRFFFDQLRKDLPRLLEELNGLFHLLGFGLQLASGMKGNRQVEPVSRHCCC
jgi:hypothetical protein